MVRHSGVHHPLALFGTQGKYNARPRIGVAKIENLSILLNFIKAEGIVLVNIGAEDIHAGNERIILGLIWTLILRYHINMGDDEGANAKDELLAWVRSKIGPSTPYGYDVQNFTKDWNGAHACPFVGLSRSLFFFFALADGRALAALIDALQPGAYPNHRELPVGDRKKHDKNCEDGINRAFDYWEVPKLLDGDDLANPKVDQNSVMTYISQFRNLDPSKLTRDLGPPPKQPGDDARNARAYGPGLQDGNMQMQPAPFKVEAPVDTTEALEVRVIGPDGEPLSAKDVTITPRAQGNWDCEYLPQEPGEYKVIVLLGGFHGSVTRARAALPHTHTHLHTSTWIGVHRHHQQGRFHWRRGQGGVLLQHHFFNAKGPRRLPQFVCALQAQGDSPARGLYSVVPCRRHGSRRQGGCVPHGWNA